MCRRHGLQVKKGICKGCIGATKKPAWYLVSPGNFDIAPWEDSPPIYDGRVAPAGKLKPAKLLLGAAEDALEGVEAAAPSPEGV